jgi:hypothetical protein
MKVELSIKEEIEEDPIEEDDKNYRFLKKIYREFPEAIWEKSKNGFRIFI